MNNEKYSIAIIDDETEILNVLSRFLIRNPNFQLILIQTLLAH